MNSFSYRCPTRIVFGKDSIAKVAEQIKAAGGTNVLMVYGGGSIKKNGIYDKVTASLKAENITYTELSGVKPNPHLDLVRKGLEVVKTKKIDFLLAVGGGSVIDSCKAISFGSVIPEDKDIWDDYFMVKGAPIPKGITLGVVLTIPAAGSEMSNSCVITNTQTNNKRGTNSENNYPTFAIMDPQVCFSLPAFQTACGAADMLSHLMERYFSNTPDVAITDSLIEATMKIILQYGPLAIKDPQNYAYREQLMFAATMAHNNLFGCGREQDWASHWLEHELSGQYDIAHGAGLAIMTPAWMKYVNKANPMRFAQFASKVMGSNIPLTDTEALVQDGIAKLEAWFKGLGLPTRLSELNLDDKDFEEMATRMLTGGRTAAGGLMKLYHEDIVKIYKLAL